jgi:hypothetical protein
MKYLKKNENHLHSCVQIGNGTNGSDAKTKPQCNGTFLTENILEPKNAIATKNY